MIKIQRIHILSNADKLKPLRKFIRELILQQNCCKEFSESVVMAINEACMNIMQHAYAGKTEEEIIIEFWKSDDEMLIRIFDDAEIADVDLIKSRDLDDIRPGGLGVHLIHEVMDSVEYKHQKNNKGNVLELRKRLKY